ncbi:MAG: arsenosugar biosynthesis radical SAM protein ArsS [Gammaproteobacteria bacterium]|nr:arsenosugar biosynthesis radical SAM protein ArsS [Gammaproteobacteria bacterium]
MSALPQSRPEFPALFRDQLTTCQVNLGYTCNQACHHCHVNAGPNRTEQMSGETVDAVLDFIDQHKIATLDLTGGAPELNPHFRRLVTAARRRGLRVIDRCNLTILEEPGQDNLAAFLAENEVVVVASLPCYDRPNVEKQRGKGVYDLSISGLKQLNALGYGRVGGRLELNLVYNPVGPSLPPSQIELENDYRRELAERHGISFNHLLTICNMPIARFRHALERDGRLDAYMDTLVHAHRDENLAAVMCRSLVSVDWEGYLYDCDFNQMLGMPLSGRRTHITELSDANVDGRAIAVDNHCFGCTAGQGSSCGGALA